MRDASEEPPREGFVCESCGRFVVTAVAGLCRTARAGSPRRFCNPACHLAAYRRRRVGVPENAVRQSTGGRDRRLAQPDHGGPRADGMPTPSEAPPGGRRRRA